MPAYDYYIQNAYFYAGAFNYSSYQDVLVQIRGLNPGWEDYGYFTVVLNAGYTTSNFDIYFSDSGFTDRASGTYYENKGYGINKEIEYQVSVYFYPLTSSSPSDRVSIQAHSNGSGVYTYIINEGGEPPPIVQQPTFSASIINSNQIYIELSNYNDVSGFVYEINGTLYYPYADATTYTSSALPNGTYEVGAYFDNGSAFIKTSSGDRYIQLTIGGGGGGDNWSYDSISPMAISTSTTPRSEPYSFSAKNGKFFTFYCDQNGTMDVYSTYPSGGPLKSYFGDTNNSYKPSDGEPYDYDDYDTGAFYYSISVSSGDTYYLWVTSANSSDFTLNIDFTLSGGGWSYSYTHTDSDVTFNVSYPPPNIYYYVYRVGTYSGGGNIYDTDDYYGYHESVSTKTVYGLTYSTTYYINVGYATSQYGTVTWLGQQSFTTGSAPITNDGKVYIYTGSGSGQGWKLAKPYIFTGSSWQPASAYIFNGSVWKKTKG